MNYMYIGEIYEMVVQNNVKFIINCKYFHLIVLANLLIIKFLM